MHQLRALTIMTIMLHHLPSGSFISALVGVFSFGGSS